MAVAYYSIDHTLVDSDLTDFPVGIKIQSSTGFMSGLGATDWQNLHATVGGSECYVEVELWDTSGEVAVLWVRMPTVSSSADTVIKIETGALNTSYVGETGDASAQSVWDSNFVAVYHMAQDPSGSAPQIIDSAPNGYDLTSEGSMTSDDLVPTDWNKGQDFDGADDYLVSGSSTVQLGTAYCIAIKFSLSSLPASTSYAVIHQGDYAVSGNQGMNVYILPSGSGNYIRVQYFQSGWRSVTTNLVPVVGDNILSISFDSGTLDLNFNLNGDTDTQSIPTAYSSFSSYPLYVGAIKSSSPVNFVPYIVDELFIINQAMSAAWKKAIYHDLNNTLLIYSATDPGGGTTEPDLPAQEIGFSGTAGGHITVKNLGLEVGIGFGVEAGAELSGQGAATNAEIGLDEIIGRSINVGRGLEAGIGLSVEAVASLVRDYGVAAEIGLGAECGAVNYSAWLRENRHLASYRYCATITGSADGLDDYPMFGLKSFQFRMRSAEPSYLSLVFVYAPALLSGISARENGEIVLDMVAVVNEEESLREELIRAPFYSVRYDLGAKSRSLAIVGYQTREYGGTRVELDNVTTETMLADGRMQFRCAQPDFYLRPGDIAIYGPHEITVDSISCLVAANSQSMDVTE